MDQTEDSWLNIALYLSTHDHELSVYLVFLWLHSSQVGDSLHKDLVYILIVLFLNITFGKH